MSTTPDDNRDNVKPDGRNAPDSLSHLTARISRFVVMLVGITIALSVVSLGLKICVRYGLFDGATKDTLALVFLCLVLAPIIFLHLQFPTTRATRCFLYLFVGCAVLHRILGLTDEIRVLDSVTLIGKDGWLHSSSRDALSAAGVGAVCATVYCLLLSLEECFASFRIDADRLKQEMSNRKRAEEESVRHQMQLERMSRLNSQSEVAAGLAHELNQPLAGICAYADTVLTLFNPPAENDADKVAILEKIRDQSLRAGQIVNRLKALATKHSIPHESVCINDIFENVLAMLHSELREANVTVDVQVPDDLPLVRGDTIQLEQVLLNLVRNATEAMSKTENHLRKVVLRASKSGRETVEISVRDNGIGMGEEATPHVFDAFFTTKREGMGMGLSICRTIIESHGGHISVTRNSDRGVTFQAVLPAASDTN